MARAKLSLRSAVALAVTAATVLLLWQVVGDASWLPWNGGGEARGLDRSLPAHASEDALLADMQRRALLRGFPGLEGESQGSGMLTGSVRLHVPGGRPLPLADVRVTVLSARAPRGRLPPDAAAGPGEAAAPGALPQGRSETQLTAQDGSFTFAGVPAGAGHVLLVRHPPYREVLQRGVAVAQDRVTDVGTILLGAPTTLSGEVVDAAGRPVGSARVQVFVDRSRPDTFDLRSSLFALQAALDPLAEAQAGGDGRFAVDDLSPGRYVLRVSAPGYATASRTGVRVTLDERSGSAKVVLDPGAGWYGTVRDEEGRPLAHARLVAVALPGERLQRLDRVDVESGADGGYRLDTLVSGVRYFVEVWAEGHAPTGQTLVAEGVKRRDLVVVRSGRVEGVVRERESGQPVPDAQVTLLAGETTTLSPVSTVTDAQGRYVLAHVAPGPLLLFTAKALGYESLGVGGDGFGGRRVVVGETTVFDVVLTPGGTVSGRLTAPDGKAVPYATVALLDPRRRWEGEETALSDVGGRYVLTGLRASTYEVRVSAPGFAPVVDETQMRVVVPPNLEPVTHDLRLSDGGLLVGRVRTPEGQPQGGVTLDVHALGGAEVRGRVRDLAAVTDALGEFRISGVPPGLDLEVSATHDEWVRVTRGPVRLLAGQQLELTFVLSDGASLPGRVEDAQGRAVADARVRWGHIGPENEDRVAQGDAFRADEALGSRVLRTDADGSFRIDRLEQGRLLLKVEREGFSDWYRRDVNVSAEGVQPAVTVKLEGALSIRGRVGAGGTGEPLAGVWVYAEENRAGADEPQDPGRVRALVATQTAADGSYVLDRLPPNRVKVAVWLAIGFKPQTRRDVVPGSTGVDFALEALPVPPAPPAGR